jgi:hypothetical protein
VGRYGDLAIVCAPQVGVGFAIHSQTRGEGHALPGP